MIQRIQSIYLALIFVLYAVMFFLPLAEFSANGKTYIISLLGVKDAMTGSIVMASSSIIAVAYTAMLAVDALIIIFLYKKRKNQIMLTRVTMLGIVAQIVGLFFMTDHIVSGYTKNFPTYSFACVVPLLTLILIYLSFRAIKKDEELVRAADRLR